VIVGPTKEIRSTGYNSFPRGIDDSVEARYERPEKYLWVAHCERNAIDNAARVGTPVAGCTIYQQVLPCLPCAIACIQAGLVEMVCNAEYVGKYKSEKWQPEFDRVIQLFKESDFKLRLVEP
jgi:dCMP deaminase